MIDDTDVDGLAAWRHDIANKVALLRIDVELLRRAVANGSVDPLLVDALHTHVDALSNALDEPHDAG